MLIASFYNVPLPDSPAQSKSKCALDNLVHSDNISLSNANPFAKTQRMIKESHKALLKYTSQQGKLLYIYKIFDSIKSNELS